MKATQISREADPDLKRLGILAVLLGFASISTDLFLPALPAMQAALGASEGTLQFAISGYLLGFGFGQLFWGPISDRFGRRGPVTLGIVVFVVGSTGCALSTDAWQLIGWRVVQAVGASAGVALARAMVRDLYERDRAAKVLSTLMTVMAVAPLIGPSIGAQILAVAPWQAIFWTLVAIGSVTAIAITTIPETLSPEHRHTDTVWQAIVGYGAMLHNRVLVGYAAAIGFFYAGIFANIAGGAFAYIGYYGLSPQLYGLVFSSGVLGLMATNFTNSRLVTHFGSNRMLIVGSVGSALAGTAMAVVAFSGVGGVAGLILTQFLFTAMNGLILANAVAGALASVETRTGAASALIGAIQYSGGMIGSAAVGLLADGTPVGMGTVMAVGGIGCLVCVVVTKRALSIGGQL